MQPSFKSFYADAKYVNESKGHCEESSVLKLVINENSNQWLLEIVLVVPGLQPPMQVHRV